MDDKQLIIQLHIRGFSYRLISQQLCCCRKTVFTVIKNWRQGKILERKKSSEKRFKLSAQKAFLVLNYFIKHPFNTYMQCISDLKLCVSPHTIKNVLNGNGIKNYTACSKPFLSIKNQMKRLQFSSKYKQWTSQWTNVAYIDEKTVQTYSNGKVLVKRRKKERYNVENLVTPEVQNTHNKVNLVGIISYNGPNMVYSVSTKLKGNHFNQLLRTKIRPLLSNNKVLMDNAKIHAKGIAYLRQDGVEVLDFPPKSADLNPIENVWAQLQKILNRKLRFRTVSNKSDLIELIRVSWKEIPQSVINNCILSMPRRLMEVIRAQGRQTRY